ncbi:MAG: N-acetylneuraminate synthase family protein [Pseudomonadota bacterium]
MSDRVEIIAEIGSNHDGDLDTAKRYVEACAKAGADAVKFQTLARETLIAPNVRDPQSGQWIDNPKYEAFGNLALSDDWHFQLKACADETGIEFMSTPFSLEAVDLLETVGVKRYKLASGDLTFRPLQARVAATGKPVLLSTGASYLAEVRQAVAALQAGGASDITVLQCTASYPPGFEELNLRAIPTLGEALGLPVGLSDHSPGLVAPIAAASLGARVIEKHITFDRTLPGPDHPFAMTMEELADLVIAMRQLEAALGDGEKAPAPSEAHRRARLRRGVYDPVSFLPAKDGVWLRPEHGE